eukprot:3422032-Rhodomonas_salina.1
MARHRYVHIHAQIGRYAGMRDQEGLIVEMTYRAECEADELGVRVEHRQTLGPEMTTIGVVIIGIIFVFTVCVFLFSTSSRAEYRQSSKTITLIIHQSPPHPTRKKANPQIL